MLRTESRRLNRPVVIWPKSHLYDKNSVLYQISTSNGGKHQRNDFRDTLHLLERSGACVHIATHVVLARQRCCWVVEALTESCIV